MNRERENFIHSALAELNEYFGYPEVRSIESDHMGAKVKLVAHDADDLSKKLKKLEKRGFKFERSELSDVLIKDVNERGSVTISRRKDSAEFNLSVTV